MGTTEQSIYNNFKLLLENLGYGIKPRTFIINLAAGFSPISYLHVASGVGGPVDNKSDMENMKMQYECWALSQQTMIDKSLYTTNTALELQRMEEEQVKEAEDNVKNVPLESVGKSIGKIADKDSPLL